MRGAAGMPRSLQRIGAVPAYHAGVVCALIFALATAPANEIVVPVRFYYPLPSQRRSYFHLYLVDLRTGKRRAITSGSADDYAPRWLNARRLVWTRSQGDREMLMEGTAPGFAPRRVRAGVKPSYEVSAEFPAWSIDYRRRAIVHQEGNGTQEFVCTNSKVRFLVNCLFEEFDYSPFEQQSLHVAQEPVSVGRVSYLIVSEALTAHELVEVLFRLDRVKKTATVIPVNAASIQIAPDGRHFVGVSERLLREGLFTNDLTIGQLPSGKTHAVITGLVRVGQPAFRPAYRAPRPRNARPSEVYAS
jgi:hypothetical protein